MLLILGARPPSSAEGRSTERLPSAVSYTVTGGTRSDSASEGRKAA